MAFYNLARGSAQESLNQLHGFLDEGLIPRKDFYPLFNLVPPLREIRRPKQQLDLAELIPREQHIRMIARHQHRRAG